MKRLFFVLLILPALSWAQPITVAWDANPPAENVVAYRVGQCPAGLTAGCTTRGETAATQLTVDVPLSASQCFRVLAINATGVTSDWSSEVCVNPTKPSTVNRFRVVIYVPAGAP
jgi:hypothetical protein